MTCGHLSNLTIIRLHCKTLVTKRDDAKMLVKGIVHSF